MIFWVSAPSVDTSEMALTLPMVIASNRFTEITFFMFNKNLVNPNFSQMPTFFRCDSISRFGV